MKKQAKTRGVCFIVSMLVLWGIFCFPRFGWTETLVDKNFEDGILPADWSPSGDWVSQNIANYTEGEGYCVQNTGASIIPMDTLQLPAMNFLHYSSIWLSFSTYFEQMEESKTIGIEVSSDGGFTWNAVWEQSGLSYMKKEAVDLSFWLAGQSTGAVRFVFEDNDGVPDNGSIWQIDNVRIEANLSPGNTIVGTVSDGIEGIAGVTVEAYNWDNPVGQNYSSAETDGFGNYTLYVYDGDWQVEVVPPYNATWVKPPPKTVTLGGAVFSMPLCFIVDKSPDGFVSGQILSPAGTALTSAESPNYGICIDAVNVETGFWYSANPDSAGNYSIPLMSGIYDIFVWVDPGIYPDYTAPLVNEPVRLTLGTVSRNIQLLSENCKIAGSVKVSETGIPGVFVDVWNEYGDWRYEITDQNGYFEVPVYPGTWYVSPFTWGKDTVMFTGQPKEVTVASGQTLTADFNMTQASQPIRGIIKNESGDVLTTLAAWVYARVDGSPNPIAETWVENGEFLINVPQGTYKVGLYLWPDSGYSFDPASDEQSITQARSKRMAAEISTTAGAAILELSGQEKSLAPPSGKDKRSGEQIVFTLKSNTKKIKGVFKNSQEAAITGISGYVFADRVLQSGEIGSSLIWHMGDIKSDGKFEIAVSAGKWELSYFLFSVPDNFPYREITKPILVTVAEADQTTTQDIELPPLGSSLLCGTVYYPDGKTPASNIIVWLRSSEVDIKDGNFMEYQTPSDKDGKFCFSLPSDISQSLSVGMAVKPMDVPGVGRASVRASGGSSQRISWPRKKRADDLKPLILRKTDMEIKGRVMRPGGTEAAAGAFVYAYSADGQKTDAIADANGSFTLEAAPAEPGRGNIWRVGAISRNQDGKYSRTKEILCNTSDTTEQSAFPVGNMVLGSGREMMDSVTHTFLPGKGWSHTLADGTGIQIPDGAIPVDKDVQQVKISVEPLVRDLPNTTEDRVVGYGYGITLRGKESGREIVKKFSKNVTVILRYTDELLTELGIREADLRPAYFLNASRSWKPLKNFTIDTVANKISFRTDHFSTWALVAKNGFPEPGNVNGSGEIGGGVTLADAMLSLQICAGVTLPNEVTVYREADVNGDLKIGQEEAVYILQKVANLR